MERWRRELEGPGGFVRFPAATAALAEFGGLRVEQGGAGVTSARETFELDPTLAVGEADRFARFESIVGRRLYPLGEAGGGQYFLAISEDGQVFGVGDSIFDIGRTISEAIENLIVGRRGRQPYCPS